MLLELLAQSFDLRGARLLHREPPNPQSWMHRGGASSGRRAGSGKGTRPSDAETLSWGVESMRMSIPRLVIVQTGTAAKKVVREHGDYPDWFNRALDAELPVVRAHVGGPLELPVGTRGVLVTGSPLSLTSPDPWMDEV